MSSAAREIVNITRMNPLYLHVHITVSHCPRDVDTNIILLLTLFGYKTHLVSQDW